MVASLSELFPLFPPASSSHTWSQRIERQKDNSVRVCYSAYANGAISTLMPPLYSKLFVAKIKFASGFSVAMPLIARMHRFYPPAIESLKVNHLVESRYAN